MKKYETPEFELIKYAPHDVICESDPDNRHVDNVESIWIQ